jgi:hypothetical protein
MNILDPKDFNQESKPKLTEIIQSSDSDDHDLEIEPLISDFQGIMHVFISHKFVKSDQKLALTMQTMFREHNIEGYMAERKREYDLLVSEKIRNKIRDSDYLVAIITKHSVYSPSVHQEIGFALGLGIPIRIMIEVEEIEGVLTKGIEVEEFTRNNITAHGEIQGDDFRGFGDIFKNHIDPYKKIFLSVKCGSMFINGLIDNLLLDVSHAKHVITEHMNGPDVHVSDYFTSIKDANTIKDIVIGILTKSGLNKEISFIGSKS